jgi:hypothetical protein
VERAPGATLGVHHGTTSRRRANALGRPIGTPVE